MAPNKPTIFATRLNRRSFLGGISTLGLMFAPGVGQAQAELDDAHQRIRALLSGSEPAIWLFTGDSVTHGALHTMGWRSYPELFAERVRWELRRTRDIVINTGISGDTTAGLLKDLDWRIFQFKPHVTSIMMGMNDCAGGPAKRDDFRSNLNKLVDAIEVHNSLPILNTTNPIYTPNTERRNDIIREVARKRKTVLVDHSSHWFEVKKTEAEMLYWLNDGSIHPNECGHREFANLIFKELGIYDPASRTSRLFVP